MVLLLCWRSFSEVTLERWFTAPSTRIAMFHTLFNVTCTLLFLPFINLLVKASIKLVPEKGQAVKTPSELMFMDKRFLVTPSVAIGQLKKETMRMADMAMASLRVAFGAFIDRDLATIENVYERNENISALSERISDYLVKVSASGASLADEKQINALHNNIGDIARIAELADNLTKYTKREVNDNLIFSDGINEKLESMHDLLHKLYELVNKIVLNNRKDLVREADALEDTVDDMRRDLIAEHITRLGQGKCKPENNTVFINLVCNLERVGDHLHYIVHSTDD